MGQGGACAGAAAPDLHGDDGLHARQLARRAQELPPVRHTLQVEDDQARLCVTPQVLEEVDFVHISHVAEGHELREPHTDAPCPVEDRRRDGAGLRHERHREAQRLYSGERCVERGGGIDDAHRVGADEADPAPRARPTMSRSRCSPSAPSSRNPALMMTADRTRAAAQSSITSPTHAAGTTTTARSTGASIAERQVYAVTPRTGSPLRLTAYTRPPNPPRSRLSRMI